MNLGEIQDVLLSRGWIAAAAWYGKVRLNSTDFLTGLASAATSLTFQAEGEYGFQ